MELIGGIGNIDNLNIQNCSILFSGIDAIRLQNCTNFKIENSTILNSNNNGISLFYGQNFYATIRNNTIQNTGIYPGMGQNGYRFLYGYNLLKVTD